MNNFQKRLRSAAVQLPELFRPPTSAAVAKKLAFIRRWDGSLNVLYDGQVMGFIRRNAENRFYAFHNVLDKGSRGVPARITLRQAKEDFCYKQVHYLQFGSRPG